MNSLAQSQKLYGSKRIDGKDPFTSLQDEIDVLNAEVAVLQTGQFTIAGTVTLDGTIASNSGVSDATVVGNYDATNHSDIVGLVNSMTPSGTLISGKKDANVVVGVRSNGDDDAFAVVSTSSSGSNSYTSLLLRIFSNGLAELSSYLKSLGMACAGVASQYVSADIMASRILSTTILNSTNVTASNLFLISAHVDDVEAGTMTSSSSTTCQNLTTSDGCIQLNATSGSNVGPNSTLGSTSARTYLGWWTASTNPDIYAALNDPSTQNGMLLNGPRNAHIVFGLRANGADDVFSVVDPYDGKLTFTPDGDYAFDAFQVRADGTMASRCPDIHDSVSYSNRVSSVWRCQRGSGDNIADSGYGLRQIFTHAAYVDEASAGGYTRYCQTRTVSEASASTSIGLAWDTWLTSASNVGAMILGAVGNLSILGRYSDKSGIVMPVGTILPFSSTDNPAGWLLCDGSSYSTSTYSDLFSAIGYTYGGSVSVFAVPDLRGRALVGKDDMGGTAANRITTGVGGIDGTVLGNTGGSQGVSLTIDTMPVHNHQYYDNTISVLQGITTSVQVATGDLSNPWNYTQTAGGGAPHKNLQPMMIVRYIIKY